MDAGGRAMQEQLPRATRNPDLMRTTLGFIAFNPAYCTYFEVEYITQGFLNYGFQ
jgi:hypothetical protein